ncbi:MAG: hypothetical protein RR522_02640, partial [Alistipes sp.]
QHMLDVFHLSDKQLQSYIALASEARLDTATTANLLNSLGDDAQRRIRDNVAYYLQQSAIEFGRLRERLPELSTSELQICALILKDKKLKEICADLNKSSSNITCQRTNIRAKLGLEKGENLHQFLKNRIMNPEPKSLADHGDTSVAPPPDCWLN